MSEKTMTETQSLLSDCVPIYYAFNTLRRRRLESHWSLLLLLFQVVLYELVVVKSLMAQQQWCRSIWFGCVSYWCCWVTNGPMLQIYVSITEKIIFLRDNVKYKHGILTMTVSVYIYTKLIFSYNHTIVQSTT